MSTTLPELFNQMNSLGLTFRRSTAGELEVVGDTSRITDAIRQAAQDHQTAILLCLPAAAQVSAAVKLTVDSAGEPAPSPPDAVSAANDIQQQLDEFGLWLRREAAWAAPRYLDSIDIRLSEAVDSQLPEVVRLQIASLVEEVRGINWASAILPRSFETDAKHAAEAGAGPAPEGGGIDDDCPF